jgi:hypothetical protein
MIRRVMMVPVYYSIGGGELCFDPKSPPFDMIGRLLIRKDGSYTFENDTTLNLVGYLDEMNDGYTIEMALQLFEEKTTSILL